MTSIRGPAYRGRRGDGNHLYGNSFAELSSGFRSGFDTGLNGDVTRKDCGNQTGADFFPTVHADVGSFKCGVGRFHERDEAFTFDHSNCLFSHGIYSPCWMV